MWDVNGHTGGQQITDLMKNNNSDMSLRKPQATSLVRATAINRSLVHNSFIILMKVGFLQFTTPLKLLLSKEGDKGTLWLLEKEESLSPSLDPLIPWTIQSIYCYYYHMFTLRIHMLTGGSPGTHGTSHSSDWSNGNKFLQFLDQFIYHVKPTHDHEVLLLLHNHESHITVPASAAIIFRIGRRWWWRQKILNVPECPPCYKVFLVYFSLGSGGGTNTENAKTLFNCV